MLLQGLQHHSTRLFALGNNVPKIITTCRFIHFAPRERCVPGRVTFTKHIHKRTNLLAAIFVRHNSTTPQTNELSNSTSVPIDAFNLPDAPVPLSDVAQTVIQLHANGDPTFSSIGLGGYGPIGLLQYFVEFLHVYGDLSWTGTIIAASLLLKLVVVPFYIKGHKAQINSQNHMPQLKLFQERLLQEQAAGNMLEGSMILEEQKQYMQKHNLNPLTPLGYTGVQAGTSLCAFFAIRGILLSDLDSLRFGGYWWFPDLTIPDPQYLLPIFSAAAIAVLTESMMQTNVMNSGMMKYFIRAAPLITLPFMIQFGSGLQLFWLTTNIYSVAQILILKVPQIQKWLNMPEKLEVSTKEASLMLNLKKWNEQNKLKKDKKSQEYRDHLLFAAKQPYVKTFKYNPKARLTSQDSQKLKMK